MGNDRADDIEARLLDVLKQVNDWLKFAEAKNVGVVGLASGAIAVLLTFIIGAQAIPSEAGLALVVGGVCLALSLLVGLLSFLPQTNLERLVTGRRGKPEATDNLFYYGHLAKYAPRHLAEALARRYAGAKPDDLGEVHADLAEQTITNARITLRKLRLFSLAVVLFVVGVLASAIGVLVASLA